MPRTGVSDAETRLLRSHSSITATCDCVYCMPLMGCSSRILMSSCPLLIDGSRASHSTSAFGRSA